MNKLQRTAGDKLDLVDVTLEKTHWLGVWHISVFNPVNGPPYEEARGGVGVLISLRDGAALQEVCGNKVLNEDVFTFGTCMAMWVWSGLSDIEGLDNYADEWAREWEAGKLAEHNHTVHAFPHIAKQRAALSPVTVALLDEAVDARLGYTTVASSKDASTEASVCEDCKGTGVYQGLGLPEPCRGCSERSN